MDEYESTRPRPSDDEDHGYGRDSGGARKPYVYAPLPEPEPAEPGQDFQPAPKTLWTRLLTIHPGEYDDEIAVDLSDIALEDTGEGMLLEYPRFRVAAPPHLREFEALSYVWGSPESPSRALIGEEGRTISITRNLDVAMRHLRYPDHPRVLWIDSLCIDQSSNAEKSRQVGYMNHIYWSAPKVVVWLGPEADDSDHAMNILGFIGEKISIEWARAEITCVNEEDEDVWGVGRSLADLPLNERDWAAIEALIKRPWFERIWIRQEVFWPDSKDAIYCGKSCINLNLFRQGLFRVTETKGSTEATLASTVVRALRISIEDLRFRMKGAKCTDPRDYVYGTLGWLIEGRDLAVKPDYSKTVSEVFQDVILRHIETSGSLAILESCGNDPAVSEHSSSAGNLNLPSWVPDWTSGINLPFVLSINRRFVRIAAGTEYVGDGVLRVAGSKKGVIKDFIELAPSTSLGFSTSLRALVPKDAAEIPYPVGGSLWDAYRIALLGDDFKHRSIPELPRTSLSEEESRAALESIILGEELPQSVGSTPVWPADSPEYRFQYGVYTCSTTNRFFITEDGLIGWAPKQARQGDHVATILGCETPSVLRPTRSPAGIQQHEVIGPCYLQGFMYGEAFLGPLPEGVRPIVHFDGDDEEPPYFEFLDAASGEMLPHDPRSDAFPDPDQSWAWRRGQTRRLKVNAEDLQSAGVDIRGFDLI